MSIQIFTSKDQSLREREIFSSEYLSGAVTLTASKAPVLTDFLGFGVAITPASCYLLSKMKKEERMSLLRDLYKDAGLNLSVGRLCIASSDYSAEIYTYEDIRGSFSTERDENM